MNLSGATFGQTPVCVFLMPESTAGPVEFGLDGFLFHQEGNPPWDFNGGAATAATPFTFAAGTHTVTALHAGGQVSATFTVTASGGGGGGGATHIKHIVNDYGAISGNTAATNQAITRWFADARSAPDDMWELVVPAGNWNPDLWDVSENTTPRLGSLIKNCRIRGAGSSVCHFGYVQLGTWGGYMGGFSRQARVNTINPGDPFVTVRNVQHINRFRAGEYIYVCSDALMLYGYPPTWQNGEYVKVASVDVALGRVYIDPATPITKRHSQTLPEIDSTPLTFVQLNPAVVRWPGHDRSEPWDPPNVGLESMFSFGKNPLNPNSQMPGGMAGFDETSWVVIDKLNDTDFTFSWQFGQPLATVSNFGVDLRGHRNGLDLAGPAMIIALDDLFGGNHEYIGFSIGSDTDLFHVNWGGGQRTYLEDIKASCGISPTMAKTVHIKSSYIGGPNLNDQMNEIDKCMGHVILEDVTGASQSFPNGPHFWIQNAGALVEVIGTSHIGLLNGCGSSCKIRGPNVHVENMYMGNWGNGVTDRVDITDGARVDFIGQINLYVTKEQIISYSNGVLKFHHLEPAPHMVFHEGHSYFFGAYDGTLHRSNTRFKCISKTADNEYVYIQTDMTGSTLPNPSVNGLAWNSWVPSVNGPAVLCAFQPEVGHQEAGTGPATIAPLAASMEP